MNRSERERRIGDLLMRAQYLAGAFEHAYTKCWEYERPSAGGDGGFEPTGRSGTSDPTPTRALLPRDTARAERLRADADLKDLTKLLGRLERFTLAYTTVTVLDVGEVCMSCAREIDRSTGRPRYCVEPHVKRPEIDGVPRVPLCRWCWNFARLWGTWPTIGLVRDHHDKPGYVTLNDVARELGVSVEELRARADVAELEAAS